MDTTKTKPELRPVFSYSTQLGVKGFHENESRDWEYVLIAKDPDEAITKFKKEIRDLAGSMPEGVTLSDFSFDEECYHDHDRYPYGVYYGKISYVDDPVKIYVSTDLVELYGQRITSDRSSGNIERVFKIKAADSGKAYDRLAEYSRQNIPSEWNLHVSDISVDEEPDVRGWFPARVTYSPRSTKTDKDVFTGIAQRYGNRESIVDRQHNIELSWELRGYDNSTTALLDLYNQKYVPGATEEVSVEEISTVDGPVYQGRVKYKEELEEIVQNRVVHRYNGSVTSARILRGFHSQTYAAPGYSADKLNCYGFINVTKDGIEGEDVDVNVGSFSETHRIRSNLWTVAYRNLLLKSVGKVNADTFRGFASGEVKFTGFQCEYESYARWVDVTFEFSVLENVTGLMIEGIGPITKNGHDLLWVETAAVYDFALRVPMKIPIAAHVVRTADYINFS